MVWRIGIGSEFTLGRYTAIGSEAFYNHAKPSHDEDVNFGLPIRTEVDMSGYGFNVQFKFKY